MKYKKEKLVKKINNIFIEIELISKKTLIWEKMEKYYELFIFFIF